MYLISKIIGFIYIIGFFIKVFYGFVIPKTEYDKIYLLLSMIIIILKIIFIFYFMIKKIEDKNYKLGDNYYKDMEDLFVCGFFIKNDNDNDNNNKNDNNNNNNNDNDNDNDNNNDNDKINDEKKYYQNLLKISTYLYLGSLCIVSYRTFYKIQIINYFNQIFLYMWICLMITVFIGLLITVATVAARRRRV